MITGLHYAGALLNPFLMNVMEIQNNGTTKRALNRIVQKLSGPLGVDFNEVMNELTQYEEQQGPYGLLRPQIFMRATSYRTSGGIEWWQCIAHPCKADSFANMLRILV
jgi:hypothetical protein